MPPDDSSAVSPAPVPLALAAFYQRQPALELSALDLCFVLALQKQAEQLGLTSFREEQLLDAFERVCRNVLPEAEQTAARATHTLRRLREQRLLTRVDGAGVARAGEYALSRLASSIADFFAEDEVLTEGSLELLARSLLGSLSEVVRNAERAKYPADWQAGVVAPLRITTCDLILGIERRQRGLDVQQEQFQREISRLLESDWFLAVDRCQQLLDDTASTLKQLNELLLRYTHQFESRLSDVLELATVAGAHTAEAVAHRVMGQLDRVAAWGSARQHAWSEYYEYVHRYLRDVVRLDPARALTERLREQLTGHAAKPFSLTVADAPALRLLREVVPPPPPAPVRRPRGERRSKLETATVVDPLEALSTQVRELCAAGPTELSRVTAAATEALPPEQRFATAGRVAELALQHAAAPSSQLRPWVLVREGLAIEDWPLGAGSGARPVGAAPRAESEEHE
jgi:chromosome partition protein MukF